MQKIDRNYFLNQIDQYIEGAEQESTVSTKYVHQRLWDILNYEWETEMAISDFMDELSANYTKDTGLSIWEEE